MTTESETTSGEKRTGFQSELKAFLSPTPLPYPIPALLALTCVFLSLLVDAGISQLIRGIVGDSPSLEMRIPTETGELSEPITYSESNDASRLLLSRTISLPLDIAMVLSILWLSGFSPARSLGLNLREIPGSLRYGITLAIVSIPMVLVINVMTRLLFRPDHAHPAFELFHSGDPWLVVMAAATAVIFAPFVEELLFRGLLQSSLSAVVGAWPAIVFIGVLFGLAHFGVWPDPIPLSFLGIVLGLTMGRTHSLWAPIFFHAFFNATMLLLSLIVG